MVMARGERWSELKGRIAGSWATPAVLIAPLYGLYAYVALTSPGFDDEFYNIRWVEEYGASIISFVQTVDVHPPLSYTLNYLLYELTGSWSLVRLASATLAVGVYYWALRKVAGAFGFNALLVFYVFLCLSPGLLMHLTSVRWYAYALPLLIWLTFIPEPVDAKWAKFAFGFLVLSYLTYAAYILCLPYFYLY